MKQTYRRVLMKTAKSIKVQVTAWNSEFVVPQRTHISCRFWDILSRNYTYVLASFYSLLVE